MTVSKKNHYKLKAKVYHWVRCLTSLSFSHRPLLFFTKRPTLMSFAVVCTHVTSWLGLDTPVVMEMRTGSGWGKRLIVQTKGCWNDRKLCQGSSLLLLMWVNRRAKRLPHLPQPALEDPSASTVQLRHLSSVAYRKPNKWKWRSLFARHPQELTWLTVLTERC